MKFDCLITNPPYQDSTHTERKNTLWRKWLSFNEKLVNDNGVFSLIIPSSWMGSRPILKESFLTNEGIIKHNIIYINRDECKRHFANIGSTFSYFIIQKKEYENSTNILSKSINREIVFAHNVDLNNILLDVFPRDLSEIGASILNKTLHSDVEKLGIINNTFNHSVHRDRWKLTSQDEFIHPIQNTPKKLYYYDYPHPDQNLLKLLIPTTTYFRVMSVSTYGVTQSFCYYLINENQNPDIILNNVNNKLFDYLNECFRYSNWNSVNLLRKLPKIPLDRMMNNNEIYEYFNLTQEEINHIDTLITWR
jgi:hypothetical protein